MLVLNFKDNNDLKAVIDLLKVRHKQDVAQVEGDNIILPGGVKVSVLQRAVVEQHITVEPKNLA